MRNIGKLKQQFKEGSLNKEAFIEKMYEEFHDVFFEISEELAMTEIQKIEISESEVTYKFGDDGFDLKVNRGDRRSAPLDALNFNTYEKCEKTWILKLLPPKPVVFDIGANIGWFSLLITANNKNAEIHAFEPLVTTFNQLVKNIILNQVKKITPYNMGFSNTDSIEKFYLDEDLSVNASLRNLSGKISVQEHLCRLNRLDSFCEEFNKIPDFIKCDVEGAELFVFEGGVNSIKQYKPIIFTEMLRKWSKPFGYHPNAIIALLAECGYKCFTMSAQKLDPIVEMTDETIETNFFFLHVEKHIDLITKFS